MINVGKFFKHDLRKIVQLELEAGEKKGKMKRPGSSCRLLREKNGLKRVT